MKEVIVTGATVEEAVDNGCSQLGVEQEAVDYEVIEQPQQKILGIFGGSPAKVRVFVKVTPSSVAIDYLTEILTNMGVKELEITEEVSDERTILNISGNDDDLGVVIGHRGETLTALQYLVSLTANNACEGYFKVSLNVKNFREKREKTLEKVASKTAFVPSLYSAFPAQNVSVVPSKGLSSAITVIEPTPITIVPASASAITFLYIGPPLFIRCCESSLYSPLTASHVFC